MPEFGAAQVSLFLFTLFNTLRVFSYIPQIYRVAQDTHGAQAISYVTWGLWVGANGSTALYAWVNLYDLPLALLNGANALCCGLVIGLTCWKRYTFERQRRAARLSSEAASHGPDLSPPSRSYAAPPPVYQPCDR
jgi:hypothetical protein